MKFKHFRKNLPLVTQRKYAVMIRGENFLVQVDGRPQKCGFYTTHYITASEPKEAFKSAVASVRHKLQDKVLNNPADNPSIYMEQAKEVKNIVWQQFRATGFSWFVEDKPK